MLVYTKYTGDPKIILRLIQPEYLKKKNTLTFLINMKQCEQKVYCTHACVVFDLYNLGKRSSVHLCPVVLCVLCVLYWAFSNFLSLSLSTLLCIGHAVVSIFSSLSLEKSVFLQDEKHMLTSFYFDSGYGDMVHDIDWFVDGQRPRRLLFLSDPITIKYFISATSYGLPWLLFTSLQVIFLRPPKTSPRFFFFFTEVKR